MAVTTPSSTTTNNNKDRVIRISSEVFRYMSVFETITSAAVNDCIVDGDHVTFIIKEGDMGLAIGKGGVNVKKVEEALGKKVDLLEFSKDPVQFAKNLLFPMKPKNAYVSQKSDGKRVLNLEFDQKDHKMFLGSAGKKRVEAVRSHLLRHYPAFDGIEIK